MHSRFCQAIERAIQARKPEAFGQMAFTPVSNTPRRLTQKIPEFTIKSAADAWSRSFFFARSPSLFGGVAQVARATVS
jgi:hypothetical protein